jgi:hypothetical protein
MIWIALGTATKARSKALQEDACPEEVIAVPVCCVDRREIFFPPWRLSNRPELGPAPK